MKTLAIDPGTNCGYAMAINGKILACNSGVWDLANQRDEGAGMRFLKLRNHIAQLEPDVIFYERVNQRQKSNAAARVYDGIVANIQSYCEEYNIPYRGIPVQTIKKHATGKGNVNKDLMLAAARKKWNYRFTDKEHDRADALWILDCGLKTLGNINAKLDVKIRKKRA